MDRESVREGIRQAIRSGTPPDKIASAIKNGRLSVIGFDDTPAYKAKDAQLRSGLDKTKREIGAARQEVDDHSLFDMSEAPGIAANLTNRMVNSATLGAYNVAMDPLSELTGMPLVPPRSERAKLAESGLPGQLAAGAADAVGAFAGAPAAIGNRVAGQALKQLAPAGSGLVRRVASGAASGGLAGGAVSAAQAGIKGEGLEEAMSETALGAGIGGAFGAAAEAMPAIKSAIRKDEKIGNLRRAEDSGMYRDDPMLKARNERELNKVAIDNQKRVADGLESRRTKLSEEYGQAQQAALLNEPELDAAKVLEPLERLSAANGGSRGQSIDPEVDKAIGEVYRVLAPDENGKISTADLLAAKRAFQSRSGDTSLPATAEERPWRILQKELGEMLPPSLQGANKRFASEMSKMERVNDVLQSSDDAAMSSRAAKERSAARSIRRVGDESEAGDIMQSQLKEIADLDPSVAEALARQAAADAFKTTRFQSMPKGLRMRDALGFAGQNLRAGGRAADSMAGALETPSRAAAAVARTMPADLMGEDLEAALRERKRRQQSRK